jgi:hypothetical protein
MLVVSEITPKVIGAAYAERYCARARIRAQAACSKRCIRSFGSFNLFVRLLLWLFRLMADIAPKAS